MKIFKKLLPFVKPLHHFIPEYLIYTIAGILFGLLNFALLVPMLSILFGRNASSIATMAKPDFSFSLEYIKDIFQYYFSAIAAEHGRFGVLVFVCSIICIGILLSNVFKYLAVKVLMRLRLKMMEKIRNKLYEKYVAQTLDYHNNHRKGDLLSTITNEVQEIESGITNALQILLREPFVVIVYFIMLFYWSYQLTLFTLIFLPITGFVITSITKRLKKMGHFSQKMMSEVVSITDESISGIRQIQSFSAGNFMINKFKQINKTFSMHSKQLYGKREMASPISEVLGVLAAVMLVVFGGYLIINNKTTLSGEGFIAYIALYTQIIQPLKNLSQTSINLQRGLVAAEKVFSILEEPVTIFTKPGTIDIKSFNTGIEMEKISFSYGQAPVIKNLSLSIPKGKIVALVGPSGSGKSTLIDLICRFFDIAEGSIKIDGININEVQLENLRGTISVVSQDAFLFNDTIANNIRLGYPNVSIEEVEKAARAANAHEFILALENGYDTVTGERGVKLSGGQRQRITIARAILKNAPILILDEATSALDTESERLVQDAINKMLENKTCIIIAHRLSTIKHANEIVVLDKGEIVEKGTHDQLMAQAGIYKKLVNMQEVK